MNYLSKVQVILPKKTKTTDTHNISTIDIILFYLDLFKNKILGTTLEILVLTFSMILLLPQDMLCRIDSSLTEVAGEGRTNWAPQKFLSSQKFRHLMG